jgi:hypothetical protein
MERTKNNQKFYLPDSINCGTVKNFTTIPNELLRNPNLSLKAKGILCLLLSNKDGWSTFLPTLQRFSIEGESAIRSGIQELEESKYLLRIRYRDKKTKIWKGSFWAYTDTPGKFLIQSHLNILEKHNLEIYINPDDPQVENLDVDTPDVGHQGLKILNNNKTKDKKIFPAEEPSTNGFITTSKFADFWKLYPRKIDQGKALTIWNRICTRKDNRPTWRQIKSSIIHQKQSERWKDIQFIPHPSTWLNQSRWLDNPEEMKRPNFDKPAGKPDKVMEGGEWYYLQEGGYYKSKSGKFYED